MDCLKWKQKRCTIVSVNLPILDDDDIDILQKYGIAAEIRNKELRLCDEAIYLTDKGQKNGSFDNTAKNR